MAWVGPIADLGTRRGTTLAWGKRRLTPAIFRPFETPTTTSSLPAVIIPEHLLHRPRQGSRLHAFDYSLIWVCRRRRGSRSCARSPRPLPQCCSRSRTLRWSRHGLSSASRIRPSPLSLSSAMRPPWDRGQPCASPRDNQAGFLRAHRD